MPTPHNSAKKGEIAGVVLLPGDPLRAEYLASTLLPDSVRVTAVRGMLGFTGTFRGVGVTVMGSGMGGPSAGIYAHELFDHYGVDTILRIGTAGGLRAGLPLGSLVLAMTASTDSNYASQFRLPGSFSPSCDFSLLEAAVASARARRLAFSVGPVFSSDFFSEYNALGPEQAWKPWSRMGCLAQDMETYALYCVASRFGRRALSLLTHTDSCVDGTGLPSDSRLDALSPMFDVALDVAAGTRARAPGADS